MTSADSWWFQAKWSDFRRGTSQLRLTWAGGSAIAQLFDEGVPRTAEGVARLLPLTIPMVHVAWSGEMLMGTTTHELGFATAENDVRLVRPGDLTWDPKVGEIGLVYGDAECRLPSGPNTVVVFASITDGLDELGVFGRSRRFEGVGEVTIERQSS